MHQILGRYRKIVDELTGIPAGLVCVMRPTQRGAEAISLVFGNPFLAKHGCNKEDCWPYYAPVCKAITRVLVDNQVDLRSVVRWVNGADPPLERITMSTSGTIEFLDEVNFSELLKAVAETLY